MDKKQLCIDTQAEMISMLQQMEITQESITETRKIINEQFDFITSLERLKEQNLMQILKQALFDQQAKVDDDGIELVDAEVFEPIDGLEEAVAEETVEIKSIVYESNKDVNGNWLRQSPKDVIGVFERKQRGGIVRDYEDPTHTCFVPEEVIAERDIYHGAIVYAKHKFTDKYSKRSIYEHSVLEEHDTDTLEPENMIVLHHTPLIFDYFDSKYIVEYEDENIEISMDDVRMFNLEDGDIIDVAFWRDNTDGARFRKKYDYDDLYHMPNGQKSWSYYKNSSNSLKKNYAQIFKGLNILLVGMEGTSGQTAMREEVEKRGGTLAVTDGNITRPSMKKYLKNCDVVITGIRYVGHRGTWKIDDLIDEYNVPWGISKNFGRGTFVRTVCDKLGLEDVVTVVSE